MVEESLTFQQQLRILLDTVRDSQGQVYRVTIIAQAAGVSEQTLHYLLDGRSHYPRLDTLRQLCLFFQITLDYFQCETEADCRAFLLLALAQRSPTIDAIVHESADLSMGGQRNVLTILDWIRRARHSGKH